MIRISGPEAVAIAAAVFDRPLRDRRVVTGRVRDPSTGDVVDEAIGILMRAPRSFTREDVVELHCHGGAVVVQRVMQFLLQQGGRAAEPGEFTLRAFLNGRIDLAQAEAVLDVVRAHRGGASRGDGRPAGEGQRRGERDPGVVACGARVSRSTHRLSR